MKPLRSFALVAMTCFASTASAQLVLNGHVSQQGTVGDPIRITLDIDPTTGGPTDPFYLATATLERAGVALPLVNPTTFTLLTGPNRWGFRTEGSSAFPTLFISLNNTGPTLPVSRTSFPDGIAMSLFLIPRAEYWYETASGPRFEVFAITSYSGSFQAGPSPVPEPASYGAFAAALLCGVVAWRRRERKSAVS